MNLIKRRKLSGLLILVLTVSTSLANNPNWKDAKWIWQQEDGPSNTWMSFRKTVTIDEIPDIVEAYIAVDSKFWLWIND